MTRAIIYVPADADLDPAAVLRCIEHCKAHGYTDGGLERDWENAAKQLKDGTADAIVVDRPEHLDPHRRPRVEVVAEHETAGGHRRTRIIRRDEAT